MRLHPQGTCGKIDTGGRKVRPEAGHELAAKVSRYEGLPEQAYRVCRSRLVGRELR